jgi:Zn-dependent protease
MPAINRQNVMEYAMLLFGDFSLVSLLAIGIVLFFGMGLHEYAHALAANWWGDPTPREQGRLTPNPIVHINWVGWIMFLLIGWGILGSVPINPRRMRDPRWGSFWTSFAGPFSNLLQAAVYAIALRVLSMFMPISAGIGFALLGDPEVGAFSNPLFDFLSLFLTVGVYFNVLLFVFNLLPLFPIDGWRMVLALLPGRGIQWNDIPAFIRENVRPLAAFLYEPAYKWEQWAMITQYIFFGLIVISFALPNVSVFGTLISQPTFAIMRLLLGI